MLGLKVRKCGLFFARSYLSVLNILRPLHIKLINTCLELEIQPVISRKIKSL